MANPDTTTTPASGTGDPGIGIGASAPATGSPLGGPPPVPTHAAADPVDPKPTASSAPATPTAADPSAPAAPASPTTWPEDWRKIIAGEDKKKADRLSRFTDPAKLFDSYAALERDLSSGKYRKALPSHPSAEELTEWRKSNGVPEKPEDYDVNLGNGIVWGEQDKPHIDDFLKWAHANNATPDEVKRGLGWWHQYQNTLVDQQNEADSVNAQGARDKLRELWGGETQRNINFLKSTLDAYDGAYATLMNARGPDGIRLGDNPVMLNALLGEFVKGNPYGRDLPGNGQDPAKTVEAEFSEIQSLMRDRSSAYWKGDKSAQMQARFRELVDVRERLSKARAG